MASEKVDPMSELDPPLTYQERVAILHARGQRVRTGRPDVDKVLDELTADLARPGLTLEDWRTIQSRALTLLAGEIAILQGLADRIAALEKPK